MTKELHLSDIFGRNVMKFLYSLVFLFLIVTSYSFANNEIGFIWEKYLKNDSVSRYLLDNHMIRVNDDEYISITPCDIVGDSYVIFTKVDSEGNILNEYRHFYYQPQSILMTFYINKSYIYNNYLYVITTQTSFIGDNASHFWRFDLNKFEVNKIVSDSTFRGGAVDYVFEKDQIIQLGVQNEDIFPHLPIYTKPLIRIFDNDFNIIETINIDTTGLGFKIYDYKDRGYLIFNTILTKDNHIFTYLNPYDTINNDIKYKFVPVKISLEGKIIWSLFNETIELKSEIFQARRTIQLDNGDIVSKFLGSIDYGREGIIKISQEGLVKDFKIFKDNSQLNKNRYFSNRDFQFIKELNIYVLPGVQYETQSKYSQIFYFLDHEFNDVFIFETNVLTEPEVSPAVRSIYYLENGMFLIYGKDGKSSLPYFAKIRLQPSSISENLNLNSKFRLYPQPSNDYFQIDGEYFTETKGDIFDLNGVLLKTVSLESSYIYIGDLANGIYYLVIDNQRLKFIKF
jgi:hypothetical protein